MFDWNPILKASADIVEALRHQGKSNFRLCSCDDPCSDYRKIWAEID